MSSATSKANQDFLYELLAGYARRGEPMPTNQALADRVGWSDRRTVMLALRALEKDKRIKVHSTQQRNRVVEILATGTRTPERPGARPAPPKPEPQTDAERRRALLDTLTMKSKLGAANPDLSLGGFQGKLTPGTGCRWIEGDDYLDKIRAGQDPACNQPRVPGRSYCLDHLEDAHQKKSGERAA